jgi:glucosamine--fructose-6-phosphate aminotransferase (isomerizing)
MVLSQSGTTIDTIDALNEAKDQGLITLGIVNEVGSKITRINHAGIYTHSGPEIGVASTKVYVAQIIACAVLTLRLARQRGMSPADGQELIVAMQNLPKQIEEVLKLHELIKTIACEYQCAESIQTLGRSYDAFSAAELALKITELSYIPTSDFPGGEMKHGPIAMVEPGFPVFAIVTQRSQRAKMHSNIIEVKSRGAEVIIFGHADDEEGRRLAKYFIPIPETLPCLSPVLTAPAIHLLAYELGVAVHELGVAPDNSVDNPRNLAKTVTVR